MIRYMILGGAALAACGILVGLMAIKDSGAKPTPAEARPATPGAQPAVQGTGTRPPAGAGIWRLYEQGKLNEARKELKRAFQLDLEYGSRPRPKSDKPMDVEGAVTNGIGAAGLVCGGMAMEAKYGEPGVIPPFLMDMAEKAISICEDGATSGQEYIGRPGYERVPGVVALMIDAKAAILASMAEAHAKAGKAELATPMLAKHAAFLDANKAAYEKWRGSYRHSISPPPPPPLAPEVPKEEVAKMQAVIEEYNKAMTAENAEALDRVLAKGEVMKTAKDLLEYLAADLAQDGRFKKPGRVVFDDKTRVTVKPRSNNQYEVLISDVLHIADKDEESVQWRHNQVFRLMESDGKYLMIFQKRTAK